MSCSIQVLTVPTADTPGTTIILLTQKQHYIFGSHAEGTQRAINQQGAKVGKVQNFFMTGGMNWANAGGLIGLTLTLADSASSSYEQSMAQFRNAMGKNRKWPEPERPSMHVYGPPNLKHALTTCRRFIFRKGIPISTTEYKNVPPARDDEGDILPGWEDGVIQVWPMCVAPEMSKPDSQVERDLEEARTLYERTANDFEEYQAPENETVEEREARYDRIREAVLTFMFNSNWNFDTLIEQHISEVRMPAAMFIRNPDTNRLEKYQGPVPGGREPLPDIKVLTRTPWPGAKVVALPPTAPAPDSLSYIVRSKSIRGVFDAKRAAELGLRPGPIYGKLNLGQSVKNDKGETITPDMVLGPERPGQGFAILDVPSADYVEALIQRDEFQSPSVMKGINVFFWLLGPGVASNVTLQQFMQKFSEVEHVISSVDNVPNRIALDSVALQTAKLAQIDPLRYNVPYHDSTTLPQKSLYGLASPENAGGLPPNTSSVGRGLSYVLMPKFQKKPETIQSEINLTNARKEMDPEILRLAKVAQEEVKNDREALAKWRQLLARPDTEIITLGTGSALPSKYRNVSATLLRVPGVGNYLFDCGENTLGQLQRVFSPSELVDVLRNLRMIWISHLHADHHLGTASVIRAWYKIVHNSVPRKDLPTATSLRPENSALYGLAVVSHEGMLKWLREYSSVDDFGYSRILPLEMMPSPAGETHGSRLRLTLPDRTNHTVPQSCYEDVLGLSDMQACHVNHCWGAMAVSLTFPRDANDPSSVPPLKVSYSGDCRPSRNFAAIGRDSTVLVHEATFDDELRGDAVAKKHSTTGEALDVGVQMGCKAVVLTHFSQRYQKIPVLKSTEEGEEGKEVEMRDVVREEEEGADEGEEGNVDVYAPAAPASAPAAKPEKPGQNERVIRVRSRDMKVAVAFDYMRVRIGDIAQLERFNAALNRLLVNEDEGEAEAAEGLEEEKQVGKGKGKGGKRGSGDEQGGQGVQGGAGRKKRRN